MNADPHVKIPSTEIVERFRNLPNARKDRLAEAAHLAQSSAEINSLAQCLGLSVQQFDAQYGTTAEAFHPPREGGQSPGTRLTLDRADNLGLRLSGLWLVENEESLDFFYVDREVSVAHRTARPRVGYDIKTDLILGNAHDGTPIVAEVKRADPENAMNADAETVEQIAESLLTALGPGSPLRRIAMLDMHESDRTLRVTKRWMHGI